jgi:putative DNA primase/helicase
MSLEVFHQILGLRDYTNGTGQIKKRDAFFEKRWGAQSLQDLFKNYKTHVEKIPNEERYNLYFTVAECSGKREFVRQKFIPFDIDNIDVTKSSDTVRVALEALGLKWENTPSLFSGNGVQFFVELKEYFTDPKFFDEQRIFYKACCDKINKALREADLPGQADSSVFSMARIMRMPHTLNVKPNKPQRMAEVLQAEMVPVSFDLQVASGVPQIAKDEVLAKWPAPDTEAVLAGCENIKAMLTTPKEIPEPLWYANASIIGHLGGNPSEGRRIWHEYSSKYPGYNAGEADQKLGQAMNASGPRTCANMSTLPGSKCGECKHFKKTKSPILLIGPNYIKTKETGFHYIIPGADGTPTTPKPAYGDLLKWFEQQHPYNVNEETAGVYTFNGKHYEKYPEQKLKGFAQKWFMKCDTKKANEFSNLVVRTNLVAPNWVADTTDRKMNFQNGVLDMDTMKFTKGHSKENGFMFVLPYEYDPHATAPRFDRFLDEVTEGDKELRQVLLEFGGYALSNDRYWEHKALLLVGSGRNGKNVFLDTLKAVAPKAYSSVPMKHLQDTQHLANLEGKLFNVSDEGSITAFKDSEIFKSITAGGEVDVKVVYEKPYSVLIKAKILIAMNEIPPSTDKTHGFFERFAIVPFNAVFTRETRDVNLISKLQAERAGILNMLLDGYREMKARGHLFRSTKGEAVLEEYKVEQDPVRQWVNACIDVGDMENGKSILSHDLYANYANFCDSEGTKPMSSVALGMRLSKLFPQGKERSASTWIKALNKTGRMWKGISIKTGEKESF